MARSLSPLSCLSCLSFTLLPVKRVHERAAPSAASLSL